MSQVDDTRTRPVAIVTGGSRGIGRAVVKELAGSGHDVAFCYQSCAEAASEAEKEARDLGARVLTMQVDVTDMPSVTSFVEATEKELGPVAVAVTSAGITRDNPLVRMTDDEWNDVVQVNLGGTYNLCRTVVFGMMKRRAGCIVNISSSAGVHGNPTQSNYSASKSGVIGFTRALSKEVGRFGIRANVVAPGYIRTDMTAEMAERRQRTAVDKVSLGRFGEPEDVARLVAFLASEHADYITGAVVQIDGGLVI
jgi:3-oxoacyl-[acyl-carrier protein] reductase